MAKIPKNIQEFIKGKMAWVSTASPDGVPNATPKGSVKVLDDEHVVFADLFSRKPGRICRRTQRLQSPSLMKKLTRATN